jgi:hypothetical protein
VAGCALMQSLWHFSLLPAWFVARKLRVKHDDVDQLYTSISLPEQTTQTYYWYSDSTVAMAPEDALLPLHVD